MLGPSLCSRFSSVILGLVAAFVSLNQLLVCKMVITIIFFFPGFSFYF